jgi:hypothetical protein
MVWANQAIVFHIALDVFVKLPELKDRFGRPERGE